MKEFLNNIPLSLEGDIYTILIYAYSSIDNNVTIKVENKKQGTTFFENIQLIDNNLDLFKELLMFRYSVVYKIPKNKEKPYLKVLNEDNVRGLILAGYTKLSEKNGDYYIEGEFKQKFLTNSELQYLINNDIKEIKLECLI